MARLCRMMASLAVSSMSKAVLEPLWHCSCAHGGHVGWQACSTTSRLQPPRVLTARIVPAPSYKQPGVHGVVIGKLTTVVLLFCCILLQAVLLLAAGCMHADAADAPDSKDSKQQPQVLAKQPKNIEEEYYNVPIRSVLGEGAKQPLSTGKIMNQLGEFEIVNEGRGDATGDLKYSTPQFSEYPAPKHQRAANGQDMVTARLTPVTWAWRRSHGHLLACLWHSSMC